MRQARALMLMGTGSDVGKSVLTAGLCRALRRRGLRVAPFKPQNMSNNAAVTADGGEIGRAQALQARACGRPPSVDMNPVLLKPESDRRAQVIVHGKPRGSLEAARFGEEHESLLPAVLESYERLSRDADVVLVEGAGSASEVNLRARDIANWGFARAADVPVVVVGDIDRGGVIASLVGTYALLEPGDGALVRGFIINKLRGDPQLFQAGVEAICARTAWPCHGVVPWLSACARLPAEDAVVLERERRGDGSAQAHVVVPMLSRIANFDDFDPLRAEPGVELTMLPPGRALPAYTDLVILPGTKATLSDLRFLRAQGWDVDILAHARRGGRVLGICGGYQMLGREVCDPDGIEGAPGREPGLGLLDVTTTLLAEKTVRNSHGQHRASGSPVEGYEIHTGVTTGKACNRPLLELGGQPEGACDATGRISGTYLHGAFTSDAFRRAFLAGLGVTGATSLCFDADVEHALDALGDELEAHLDIDALLRASR